MTIYLPGPGPLLPVPKPEDAGVVAASTTPINLLASLGVG